MSVRDTRTTGLMQPKDTLRTYNKSHVSFAVSEKQSNGFLNNWLSRRQQIPDLWARWSPKHEVMILRAKSNTTQHEHPKREDPITFTRYGREPLFSNRSLVMIELWKRKTIGNRRNDRSHYISSTLYELSTIF